MPAKLSLESLLAHDELRLELVTSGDEVLRRRVCGAHSIEVEQPSRWLAPEWVVLTTGARLRGRADQQRALVRDLAQLGATAVGFAHDVHFRRSPPALLDEAERVALPVFGVPLETPFRAIISFVHQVLASSETWRLQRQLSLQRHFLDALGATDPCRELVARLAATLDVGAALAGPNGAWRAHAGAVGAAGAPGRAPRPGTIEHSEHCDRSVTSIAVGESGHQLVVICLAGSPLPELTRPALRAAAPIMAAALVTEQAAARQERALVDATVRALVAGVPAARAPELEARLAALGIELAAGAQVAVLAGGEAGAPDADALRGVSTTIVGTSAHGEPVALLPAVDTAERERLARHLPAGVGLGLGRTFTAAPDASLSYVDARVAARAAAAGGGGLTTYAEIALTDRVVARLAPAQAELDLGPVLAVMRSSPVVREAIVAYLDHRMDAAAAARAVGVPPNTLRYRLERVAVALGRPLRDPELVASIQLALAHERRLARDRP